MCGVRSNLCVLAVAGWLALAATSGCRHGGDLLGAPEAPTVEELSSSAGGGHSMVAGATTSSVPSNGEFYPLSIGDLWTFNRTVTITVEVLTDPPDVRVETSEATVEREIVGTEVIEGVSYLVERTSLEVNGRPGVKTTWTRFRQDRSGLYVADVSTTRPPPSDLAAPASSDAGGGLVSHAFREFLTGAGRPKSPAVRLAMSEHIRRLETVERALEPGDADAGGPAQESGPPGEIFPGELRALDYPLHPGAAWFTRIEPFTVRSEVEAQEVLSLPAGRFPCYRVRVDNELLEPEDRIVAWYGRCGNLANSRHVETLAMDVETGEIARITTDDMTLLSGVSLAEPGGCENRSRD